MSYPHRLERTMVASALMLVITGCAHPKITAVSLDPATFGRKTGIPFYLPKPLLIVSKNFRNIEEAKVGLTDPVNVPATFDDQSKFADLNARTSFLESGAGAGPEKKSELIPAPGVLVAPVKALPRLHSHGGAPVSPRDLPDDGVAPDTFFTYQVIFVPDLSQKFGLKVRGGVGEVRAAMNLVNGWQFTGLGPFYLKDSATAQNVLASGISAKLTGQGVAAVVKSVAELGGLPALATARPPEDVYADDPRLQRLSRSISALPLEHRTITLPRYAEIHVFEPRIGCDGQMTWFEIANMAFDRQVLGFVDRAGVAENDPKQAGWPTRGQDPSESMTHKAVAIALGLPTKTDPDRDGPDETH